MKFLYVWLSAVMTLPARLVIFFLLQMNLFDEIGEYEMSNSFCVYFIIDEKIHRRKFLLPFSQVKGCDITS